MPVFNGQAPEAAQISRFGGLVQLPLRERMLQRKQQLEKELEDVQLLLGMLDKNPDIETVLNLMARIGM